MTATDKEQISVKELLKDSPKNWGKWGPDDELGDVVSTMGSQRVRRLPVVDEAGRLVGLVSLSDLARRADLDREYRPMGMPDLETVAETLAQICRPWSQQNEDRVLPVREEAPKRAYELTA